MAATEGVPAHEVRFQLHPVAAYAGRALLDFLAYHVVPGVEVAGPGTYARTLDLPHGPGTLQLELSSGPDARDELPLATLRLTDPRDEALACDRLRRMLDVDRDPADVLAALGGDPVLGPLVTAEPGLRVPGQMDPHETAVRTVIGQQVSVTGARTVTGRIVAAHGRPVETGITGLTHLFPDAATLAAVDPTTLPMPRARGRALVGLTAALASGSVTLDLADPSVADLAGVRRGLLALPGIGPWTADYVAMRALGDPDVFLATDLGVRNALRNLGHDPVAVCARQADWSPWRSYALMHLWRTLIPG